MEEDRPKIIDTDRRRALLRLIGALTALAGALVGLPVLGFLVAPVRRREDLPWRGVGKLDGFPLGKTVRVVFQLEDSPAGSGPTGKGAAFVRRVGEAELEAFSIHCTHTGCPVDWLEGARLFLCPCHGGSFGEDGRVLGGPPPAPLPRHEVRVREGLVELRVRPLAART